MEKYYYEGPTFELWSGSWSPTFKFLGGPGVPPLNYRGYRVPLLNFEGRPGSRVPVPESRGPGSWDPGLIFTPCYTKNNVPKKLPNTGKYSGRWSLLAKLQGNIRSIQHLIYSKRDCFKICGHSPRHFVEHSLTNILEYPWQISFWLEIFIGY